MSKGTPATQALTRAKVRFELLEYDYVSGQAQIGLHAAEQIGWPPEQVLKTLMVEVDGKPCCAAIPSGATLSMKRVASAFGGKSAQMMDPAKAERLTGMHTGGISPFGQKKRVPTVFEAAAMAAEQVVLNGGRRGLMVVVTPRDALEVSGGRAAPLAAD
ncbi:MULTISPECIES: aminoacyl-tRNA deacylase [unclassified Salipiger]|uniref:aminoacyl-tRNA deacylase n=1 Tax=unclassified Salipiger TaxID=2640570 RepID=UPI0013BB686F|nr:MULTISPECIES: aminoacyl-tRNA deacylase [unclassified Salipiger]NDV53216.1 aminoacyl-tRNA deacylase [Salipiger sp. PrR003]NDW34814.1 aminoacyl-tRNA deacylase [Salipiger sp. PrR007]